MLVPARDVCQQKLAGNTRAAKISIWSLINHILHDNPETNLCDVHIILTMRSTHMINRGMTNLLILTKKHYFSKIMIKNLHWMIWAVQTFQMIPFRYFGGFWIQKIDCCVFFLNTILVMAYWTIKSGLILCFAWTITKHKNRGHQSWGHLHDSDLDIAQEICRNLFLFLRCLNTQQLVLYDPSFLFLIDSFCEYVLVRVKHQMFLFALP